MNFRRGPLALGLAFFLLLAARAFAAPLFPDIPERHWAGDAVAALAARGLVEGYPDGTFKGDRVASRWELALIVGRLLARMEQEHATFATRAEIEEVGQLARALREELELLGVRVAGLEDTTSRLDRRVTELERVKFYGRLEAVAASQNFYNVGPVTAPSVGTGPASSARPQIQGVIPAVDYQRARALTTGAGFTSRAILGMNLTVMEEWDLTTQFAAYTSQGDLFVDTYWGVPPPNLLAMITATANDNHQPFTSMVLDRIRLEHRPSRTQLTLGSFDDIWMDSLIYSGQPNLSIFAPSRYVGYGFQIRGVTGPDKTDRLRWEVFGTRSGDGNVYQGLDYRHHILGADLTCDFAEGNGRVRLNFARQTDEPPAGGLNFSGLNTATNVAYGASRGWTPVQWVNPPGFFIADLSGAPLNGTVFNPNLQDKRPIPGWNAGADNAVGITSGGGNYGPSIQKTWGVSAKYQTAFGLRLAGEYAGSDFRSNRNSSFSQSGDAWRVELGGAAGAVDITADYLRVDPTYNPNLYPNGALGRRAPLTLLMGGRFQMFDTGFYPSNRTGPRLRLKGQFEDGSWWATGSFLQQTRTSLYDVRSPAGSLGSGNPNFPVIGFEPGFIDPVFSGYAHPYLYGNRSASSFSDLLEPFEDPRGYERMVGGGVTWRNYTLGYENRRFSRETGLTPQLGGSQNLVAMTTQWIALQTQWDLQPDLRMRAGIDWYEVRGHLDPAGLYNGFAVNRSSVDFENLDSTQLVPTLGFEFQLSDRASVAITGRHYITKDHVDSDLSTAAIGHPFDWAGTQILTEYRVEF